MSNWIPIREREPDTADHVLVTVEWSKDDLEVMELDYGVTKYTLQNASNIYEIDELQALMDHIVAWMPMPEPYKE